MTTLCQIVKMHIIEKKADKNIAKMLRGDDGWDGKQQ